MRSYVPRYGCAAQIETYNTGLIDFPSCPLPLEKRHDLPRTRSPSHLLSIFYIIVILPFLYPLATYVCANPFTSFASLLSDALTTFPPLTTHSLTLQPRLTASAEFVFHISTPCLPIYLYSSIDRYTSRFFIIITQSSPSSYILVTSQVLEPLCCREGCIF